MRMLWLVVLTSACATVDTRGMTEGCKALYQACVDRCPDENARTADSSTALQATPARQSMGATPESTAVPPKEQRQALSCEQDCAAQARLCH